MAKVTSAIQFTGKLGNMIAYRVKGKVRLRTAPDVVVQTPATRRAALDFGTASRAAAAVRQGMTKEMITYHDDSFAGRLMKAMIGIVGADIRHRSGRRRVTAGNLQALKGFQINKHNNIKCNHAVQRLYDGNLEVTVTQPLHQLHHKIEYIQFRAVAIFPDMEGGASAVAVSETVTLHRDDRIDAFCLTIPTQHQGDCLVVLEAISCAMSDGRLQQMGYRNYNALDVIAIVPAAKIQGTKVDYPPAQKENLRSTKAAAKAKGAPPG